MIDARSGRKLAGGFPGRKTKGGVKTKNTAQLDARRQKVTELYLEGESMMTIAKQLKISDATVWRDIEEARLEWRTKALENIEKLRQRELSRIDWIEYEAVKAWRRSIGIHTKTIDKRGNKPGDQGGPYDELVEQKELLAGDSKFLDVINKCVENRRKILGLDAPERKTLSNPDGSPLLAGIKVIEVGKA